MKRCAVVCVCAFTRGNVCHRICLSGFYLCLYSVAASQPGINPITGLKLADIVKQLERRKHRMTKPAHIWHEAKSSNYMLSPLQPIPVPHAVINVIQWLFFPGSSCEYPLIEMSKVSKTLHPLAVFLPLSNLMPNQGQITSDKRHDL